MTGGDLSRSTFAPWRGFSGVRTQQGRVQLDADWNEQVDIQAHRDHAEATGVIGTAGAPKRGGGFQVVATPDGADLAITPGRLWVDGTLCELAAEPVGATGLTADGVTVANLLVDGRQLDRHQWVELAAAGASRPLLARIAGVDPATGRLTFAAPIDPAELPGRLTLRRVTTYTTQPDLPDPEHTGQAGEDAPRTIALDDGTWLAYVEVWQRTVTAVEEPAIREVALGGPDTATRTRTVAQVRLLPLGELPPDQACGDDLPGWRALVAAPSGTMAARAVPEDAAAGPCVLPPGGGFGGVENQLYRVQVHDVLADGTATFTWSRDNASVVAPWLDADGDQLTVAHPGGEGVLGFAGGDWVELTDDTRELRGRPGTLVRLLKADGDLLVVDEATATGTLDHADFPGTPKVRRWDSPGAVAVRPDVAIELEQGIEVLFPGGGDYRIGDHWLIPARTAVADVEWPRDAGGRPLALPPAGTARAHARLALVRVAGGAVEAADCRETFPALTELAAADVAYHGAACDLPDAHTVQDAIDRLCQERDLRFHNRHLHGWGIVCGLEVHCGPNPAETGRRNVTVLPGYAIDAGGNDRTIDAPGVEVDVIGAVDALEAGGATILDPDGDGEVSLRLGTDAELRTVVKVERFEPDRPDATPSWLTGTLLHDFYTDCVKPVRDWLDEQLKPAPGEGSLPASPASQRVSALTNLLAQAVNPTSGSNVFLSPREHGLIEAFYTGLRELLRSETFCAMFDSARPLPDYPFAKLGMDTIFATGRHHRLRLRPGGKEAYSVGPGMDPRRPNSTLNRYDLVKGVQVAVIDPISGGQQDRATAAAATDTGAGAIQDVAFSPDGKRIFVAVASRSEDSTIFRAGVIAADHIDWDPTVTLCGIKLVTLATTAADPGHVYAVGLRKVTVTVGTGTVERWEGAGLFQLNPDAIDPDSLPPVPTPGFVPVGPLAITADGQVALAGTAPGEPADRYTSLAHLKLPSGQELTPRMVLPAGSATAAGDVAFVSGLDAPGQLYAVVDGNAVTAPRAVVGFQPGTGKQSAFIAVAGAPTSMRLLPLDRHLLVTLEDRYVGLLYDTFSGKQVLDYLLPLQVGPSWIVRQGRGSAYVLNRLSNTISVVPPALLSPAFVFPVADLVDYRKGVLEAFADLLGGFLQYLKDCLADHFLIKCPEATGDEKLYLGCVSIRSGQVYKVCNFTRRRQVKSFPAVGYWLSLVPILPFLRSLLERWACAILPDYFGTVEVTGAGEEAPGEDRLPVGTLDTLINWAQTSDPLGRVEEVRTRTRLAATTMAMAMGGVRPAGGVAGPRTAASSIVGQPVDRVAEALTRRGMTVHQAPFDPSSLGAAAMRTVLGLFRDPAPGTDVTLYEEHGTTRLFSVADPTPAEPATTQLRAQVAALGAALEARDRTLTALTDRLAALERTVTEPPAKPQRRPSPRRRATPPTQEPPREPPDQG
jgi:hypothetical protein